MATEGNGDPPVPDLQTMEELCQPSLNGRGGPISSIAIQATNFGLKNDMIQQVQNSCQFHELSGDDANKHLDKFLHVTQSIKVIVVIDDALHLYLFPHSLTHHATTWFDCLPRNSINTFEKIAKMFLGKYFPPSMVTKLSNEITNFRQRPDESLFDAWERGTFMKRCLEECYDLIENMTAYHNDWDTSAQRSESSSSITSSSNPKILALKAEMAETCGGPHSYNDSPATIGQTQNVYAAGAYQGGNSYQPQVVERETEVTKDTIPPTYNGSTKDVQPPVVQVKTPIPNSKPVVAPVGEPVAAPVSALKPNPKPLIPYPSRLHDQKLRDKTNDQKEKFFKNVQDLNFNISFADSLILMPKYSANYNDMMTNRIDVIDMAREKYSQEVLGFSDVIASGNPTPYYDTIVSTSSPTLTPFRDSDFLLEEVDAFLALEDVATLPEVYHSYYDPERDILLLESFLNDDPSLLSPNKGMYLPQVRKELKICEAKND
uniref:Retrotransposon gag domain-containing protein n=1 Tax=Tanacetum cinerariifolium TaxID=118510 RepID=A0A6L2L9Q2_TANCI|nr:hypothetical protein [Tanacetum cinerariifolium]